MLRSSSVSLAATSVTAFRRNESPSAAVSLRSAGVARFASCEMSACTFARTSPLIDSCCAVRRVSSARNFSSSVIQLPWLSRCKRYANRVVGCEELGRSEMVSAPQSIGSSLRQPDFTSPTFLRLSGRHRVPRLRSIRVAAAVCAAIVQVALLCGQTQTSHPYVGITYVDRMESSPRPEHMHVLQIALEEPGLRFRVSPPDGSRETVRQRTVEYLRQTHAQFAINAHFFLPFPSGDTDAWAIGLAASEGRVYSAF